MTSNQWRDIYQTSDELKFLRELKERNPQAFAAYAAIITSGMRTFDRSVDVGRVRGFCKRETAQQLLTHV